MLLGPTCKKTNLMVSLKKKSCWSFTRDVSRVVQQSLLYLLLLVLFFISDVVLLGNTSFFSFSSLDSCGCECNGWLAYCFVWFV
jgi:hypothetical protein